MTEMGNCANLNTVVECGASSWIYFNQPIDQIEGFDCAKPQILMHGANCGLTWKDLDCTSVVKCIKISDAEDKIEIKKKNVVIIKDLGDDTSDTDCPAIELTSCDPQNTPTPSTTEPTPSPSPSEPAP